MVFDYLIPSNEPPTAIVIMVGDDVRQVKEGDRIAFQTNGGTPIEVGNETLLVLFENQVYYEIIPEHI